MAWQQLSQSRRKPSSLTDFDVAPFSIIRDTSEQHPFSFVGMRTDAARSGKSLIVKIKDASLETGDYAIEGYETRMAVERKSLEDFLRCVGTDRDRFEKQLTRLNNLERGYVVVEADWSRILEKHEYSKVPPQSILGSIFAWQHRLPNIHWWMCPSRLFAEHATFQILRRFWLDVTSNTGAAASGEVQ